MINCFCFPYAGGSARVYKAWNKLEHIRIIPVELPGRGERFNEPLPRSMRQLVEDLGVRLTPQLQHEPYVLFGHSMGSLIAYELAQWLYQRDLPRPLHLFASGRRAPQLPRAALTRRSQPVCMLSDAQLIDELRALNGTPAAVLANQELLELFLPIIRADFSLDDNYIYQHSVPLECPITALGGAQDSAEVSYQALTAWCEQTCAKFDLQIYEGDHFYLFGSAQPAVLSLLQRTLLLR